MPNLTFSDEGPQYYGLAYARNKPMAKGGPYFTKLSPTEEIQFRHWLKTSGNPSNFDPDAKIADYDMRGYWKDVASKGKNLSAINTSDQRLHFPDTYKTPYDTTFSGESRYAKPNLPLKWVDSGVPGKERLINTKTGEVLFLKTAPGKVPGYPAGRLPDVTEPPVLRPVPQQSVLQRTQAPDYSQTSIMNPRYSPAMTEMAGPQLGDYQQFAQRFAQEPRQAIKPTPEEVQHMLKMAMAFGGADITKEQRDAWEAENVRYREGSPASGKTARQVYEPGTRVKFRLLGTRRGTISGDPVEGGQAEFGAGQGTIVMPGTVESGPPLYPDVKGNSDPPGPGWVRVRSDTSPGWHWRHRDALEVLPPEEKFKIGDTVERNMDDMIYGERGGEMMMGRISEPPPSAPPAPSPDFVWADIDRRYKPYRRDIVKYKSGHWGAWFHKTFWNKASK